MAIELLEMSCETPNMLPHILTHLKHVACLLGHDDDITTTPTTDPVDPATISLFDAPSNIDRTIESVIQAVVERCLPSTLLVAVSAAAASADDADPAAPTSSSESLYTYSTFI